MTPMRKRPEIKKTYKLFVGGQFPRSESGRSYSPPGQPHVNVARASRKDLRDAVQKARAAFPDWSARSGYNRGQILYRLGEMLQSHAASLAAELAACGRSPAAARAEVERCLELVTWYAGLPDKLQSLLGAQNGVNGPFFNFSTVEPSGVVGVVAPEAPALVGLLALLLPVLAGGNTVVAIASESAPLPGLALGELLAVSDVPPGAVNLLAGQHKELLPHLAAHRDVDGLLLAGKPDAALGGAAADSIKRVRCAELTAAEWERVAPSLLWVEPFVEVKTLWHPVAY
jgi:acyl-CoA reductase-like NAD-dependent aldehyde dehydrogenase